MATNLNQDKKGALKSAMGKVKAPLGKAFDAGMKSAINPAAPMASSQFRALDSALKGLSSSRPVPSLTGPSSGPLDARPARDAADKKYFTVQGREGASDVFNKATVEKQREFLKKTARAQRGANRLQNRTQDIGFTPESPAKRRQGLNTDLSPLYPKG
jgi:hypothetical protein